MPAHQTRPPYEMVVSLIEDLGSLPDHYDVSVRSMTPILPSNWWNWVDRCRNEIIDNYREFVESTLIESPTVPTNRSVTWERIIWARNPEASSVILPYASMPTIGDLREQANWHLLQYDDAPIKCTRTTEGVRCNNEEMQFEFDHHVIMALFEDGWPSPVRRCDREFYIVISNRELEKYNDLVGQLKNPDNFDHIRLLDWYSNELHSSESAARFCEITTEVENELEVTWQEKAEELPFPSEATIFEVMWESDGTVQRLPFIGISASDWDPTRKTMMLDLWLPGDEFRPIDHLLDVWRIAHQASNAVSGLP